MTTPGTPGMLRRDTSFCGNNRGTCRVHVHANAGNPMTKSLLNLMLFLVLSAGPLAHAQDDEPQKPEDVYRYAAFDTGDAIEVPGRGRGARHRAGSCPSPWRYCG